MKKLLILGMALSALLIAVPVSAKPGTLYVDDDGLCGGNAPCYTTISAALAIASDGDHILVYPGTYYEEIVVDKSVTIKAITGLGDAIVDAVATTYGRPFMVVAPYVTIAGFTIKAGHQSCCNTGIPVMIGGIFPGDTRYQARRIM